MQTSFKCLSLTGLLISLGMLASIACATPPASTDPSGVPEPPPPSTLRTKTDAGPGAAPGTKETTAPGATPTAASCKQTDSAACHACCDKAFPGVDTEKQYLACVCAPDACQTACKEHTCSGRPDANDSYEDNACFACESGLWETCTTKAQAACDADPSCKALVACHVACPVTTDGDDGGSSGGGDDGEQPEPKP